MFYEFAFYESFEKTKTVNKGNVHGWYSFAESKNVTSRFML